jgi:type II secretory pathway pseudopilin PulG
VDIAAMQPTYALMSGGEEPSVSWAAAAGAAVLVTALLALPFLIWRPTRRWAGIALGVCALVELALLPNPRVPAFYWSAGGAALEVLLIVLVVAWLPVLVMLWRRTRRAGLVLLGGSLIGLLVLANYWAQVICTIGYVLLLLALWPRWRLMQAAPRGRDRPPVIPARGVLRARAWPACRRPEIDGFTLISALVGIALVIMAAAVAMAAASATMAAVRRADRLAVATDLLESARERSLLGGTSASLQEQVPRLLPRGKVTITRTPAAPGLARVSAVAIWQEPDGKAGQVALEWLSAESPP